VPDPAVGRINQFSELRLEFPNLLAVGTRGDGVTHDGERDDGRRCPACGAGLYRRHCKQVCPNHGVVYDCSDALQLNDLPRGG